MGQLAWIKDVWEVPNWNRKICVNLWRLWIKESEITEVSLYIYCIEWWVSKYYMNLLKVIDSLAFVYFCFKFVKIPQSSDWSLPVVFCGSNKNFTLNSLATLIAVNCVGTLSIIRIVSFWLFYQILLKFNKKVPYSSKNSLVSVIHRKCFWSNLLKHIGFLHELKRGPQLIIAACVCAIARSYYILRWLKASNISLVTCNKWTLGKHW